MLPFKSILLLSPKKTFFQEISQSYGPEATLLLKNIFLLKNILRLYAHFGAFIEDIAYDVLVFQSFLLFFTKMTFFKTFDKPMVLKLPCYGRIFHA